MKIKELRVGNLVHVLSNVNGVRLPSDQFHLIGYNNRNFDDRFFRSWFDQNNDRFFGSWFWSDSIDVLVLASQFLIEERHTMNNFKLETVAKKLGLSVASDKLHDALYDLNLTYEAYKICTES
jgi:DNA polymerase-3 subunit epsilon